MSEQTKTLLVILLDQSGSMGRLRDRMIESFNNFVDAQKSLESDSARVILIKFDSIVTFSRLGVPLTDVKSLNYDNYKPDGETALYDAVTTGIQMANKWKYDDERVLFVIITDGEDTISRYSDEFSVKSMIEELKDKPDWNFRYLGAHPIKWSKKVGMDVVDCATFDTRNVESSMSSLSQNLSQTRTSSGKIDAPRSEPN